MIHVQVAMAKLKPELWPKISDGTKRYEVRDEYTDADFFVFVGPEAGELLGAARITSCFEMRGDRDIEAIAALANITPQEAEELFGTDDAPQEADALFVYRISPCTRPLATEITNITHLENGDAK